jgi:hypothetical protein
MRCLKSRRYAVAALTAVMALSVVVAVPGVAAATPPPFAQLDTGLYAAPPQAGAHFGTSVAASGDTIVVGEPDWVTPEIPVAATKVGRVHVYVKSGSDWVLQQELKVSPPGAGAGSDFGRSVAIDGDWLVVGAPKCVSGGVSTGAAFIYRRVGTVWSLDQTLVGATIGSNEIYGSSVAIDGTTIAVGAPLSDGGRGSVWPYAFDGIDWVTQGTLTDASISADGQLGGSVAVDGDSIVAGATGDDYGISAVMTDAGSAHWFTRSGVTWTHEQTIKPTDATADGHFGGPIAISEGRILVGSWSKTIGGVLGAGEAYTFVNNGAAWSQESTFTAIAPAEGDGFGSSVALDGRTALIGAWYANGYHGDAYFYTYGAGAWTQRQKLDLATNVPEVTQLGTSAALSRGHAVLGAQMSSSPGPTLIGAGAAYVFDTRGAVSGVVRDAATGLPVAGIEVSAYVPDVYGEPELVLYANTDALGRYSLSLDTGDYRIGWMDGTQAYYPGFYNEVDLWSGSSTVSVAATATTTIDLSIHAKPVVYLKKPLSPSTVRRLRRFTISGYLKPRHRPGSYPVQVQCYLYQRQPNGGYAWVLAKTVSARAYDYRPNRRRAWYTKYKATFSLPSRGKWRIRAYHPPDATYGPSYSPWRYITVR